jgi:hypothetical protein
VTGERAEIPTGYPVGHVIRVEREPIRLENLHDTSSAATRTARAARSAAARRP